MRGADTKKNQPVLSTGSSWAGYPIMSPVGPVVGEESPLTEFILEMMRPSPGIPL